MTHSATPRTQLAALLIARGWSATRFCRAYQQTAITLNVGSGYLAERTAKRWIAAEVTDPRAPAAAVLHAMFGADIPTLFGPPLPRPQRDPALTHRAALVPETRSGDDDHTRPAVSGEVSTTRRRDLLGTGIALTAASAVDGPADRAARISRAIAAASPDPLTLAQLQHGIHRLTTLYAVTPHGDLVEPIERAWDDAEALLETRVTGSTRKDLELVAGQYAYYRGQLAFDMSDERTALTFFVLAAQHADAAGDNLLAGSVTVMRSALAFFSGDHTQAATIAERGQPGAHPYIAPLLAGSLARAYAQTGNADGTRDALRAMRDTVWTGSSLPGPNLGNYEFSESFSAIAFTYLNRGDEAERHARTSLTLLDGTGRHVQLAGTQLALARAYLRRANPDPEQAANAVTDALRTAEGTDHPRTTARAAAIHRHLTTDADWTKLPAVRDLTDRLPTRRALSPGTTV
jgi:hypothetical protein